jgi:hypothetical protein
LSVSCLHYIDHQRREQGVDLFLVFFWLVGLIFYPFEACKKSSFGLKSKGHKILSLHCIDHQRREQGFDLLLVFFGSLD